MENNLQHHGILGQKWGVRRFQNKDGSLTKAGKERIQNKDNSSSKVDKEKTQNKQTADEFINERMGNKITSNVTGGGEEFIAYAVSIVSYVALMKGVSKISEKISRKNCLKELDELKEDRDIESFDKAPKLRSKMSPDKSMKVTNPDYPDDGTTMNCTFCTTALALREKGYDVKATKLTDGMYSDDFFKTTFNSPEVKVSKKTTPTSLLDDLSANGEGSYGNLTVRWKYGGGHSVFWKVENGETHIYDGQNGKEYTKDNATYRTFTKELSLGKSTYNRLDNCEPTTYALAAVESNKKK